MRRRFLHRGRYLCAIGAWCFFVEPAPAGRAQEKSVPQSATRADDSEATQEADPVPAMFAHPETDRWWISGQANWISPWHPAFRSPYQGVHSLSPEAQDATSRVLTLFTGLRLTGTTEFLLDVQETAGHGIGEGRGRGGASHLGVGRNLLLG